MLTTEDELEAMEIVISGQQLECVTNAISSTTRFNTTILLIDLSWVSDEDCAQEIES